MEELSDVFRVRTKSMDGRDPGRCRQKVLNVRKEMAGFCHSSRIVIILTERLETLICNFSAHHILGSSPGWGDNFHVGMFSRLPACGYKSVAFLHQ